MEVNAKKLAKFLKESVDWLIKEQMGCCHLKLDSRLAVCVGWQEGYGDEKRDDVIQGEGDDLDYAIIAGIKVWTSDDMLTDYDYIAFPYYENGENEVYETAISPNEDYEALAESLLKDYEFLKALNIDENGEILPDEEGDVEVDADVEVDESKPMNEGEDETVRIRSAVYNHFKEGVLEEKFFDLIVDLIERVDGNYRDEDAINEALDAGLIYTEDEWTVIEHYCSPQDANYNDATMWLYEDMLAICEDLADGEDNDDEEDE